MAFITAGNILLESIVGSAAVARAWTSYFTTPLNRPSNSLRIQTHLKEGFSLLDPTAVGVLVIAATIAMISTRKTSYFNWIATALNTLVIIFVIIAGFVHANTSNLTPFFPYGAEGIFRAAAIVYFAYGGFDNIATMAEETKNPSRDIPLGLVGSMSIITVIYCLMALSLSVMQKYTDIDRNAPYSVAFQSVGMNWAKYLVSLGALKGMITVLLVGALGQAQYTTHMHLVIAEHPIYLHDDGCCTSGEEILCKRDNATNKPLEVSFLPADHCCIIHGDFSILGTETKWVVWICHICSLLVPADYRDTHDSPQQRTPKVWGFPLVPLLPSWSIATNIFLMGSLSKQAFIRFGICTAIMLLYYVFFGLHATYDMAHQQQKPEPGEVTDDDMAEKGH
ncbi:cationic amino acid transporter, putative [Ricinus communis]|uniref:Cationic amino acid transporter, putative n=1 Tax=Ricinus communis TaxID=3988 RepID=B9SQ75_RICCO|nr:cationic amino acid transporter, putative [Ricinus communis]